MIGSGAVKARGSPGSQDPPLGGGGGACRLSHGALRPRNSPHSNPVSYIALICAGDRILPNRPSASVRIEPSPPANWSQPLTLREYGEIWPSAIAAFAYSIAS